MNMFVEQFVNAYALAKTIGCELSAKEFLEKYSEYKTEALDAINSSNPQLAKCEAIQQTYK